MEQLSPYKPDVGINRIARVSTPPAELPARRDSQPTGEPIRQKLDELFPTHQVDHVVRAFASPSVSDQSVTTPRRFDGLVRRSAAGLEQYLELADGKHVDLAPLKKAAEVLREEVGLRDLLHQYRVALTQV